MGTAEDKPKDYTYRLRIKELQDELRDVEKKLKDLNKAPEPVSEIITNQDNLRKWRDKLYSKNGFMVLSKIDRKVLETLIDQKLRILELGKVRK